MAALSQERGTAETDVSCWNKIASGKLRTCFNLTKNNGGKLSGPEDRLHLSLSIAEATLAGVNSILKSGSQLAEEQGGRAPSWC